MTADDYTKQGSAPTGKLDDVQRCNRCGEKTNGALTCVACAESIGDTLHATAVAGRYRVKKLLAQGGLNDVQRCNRCGEKTNGAPTCVACAESIGDPLLGITVAGRYRIEKLLAQGGMGRVYKATHLSLGEPVVVKFLLAAWAAHPSSRARLEREARALARLRHPGVTAVYDFGDHEGMPFMVIEYLDGETLAARICATTVMPSVGDAAAIFDPILRTIEAAHGLGIVHRDLKPENVMVLSTSDGQPYAKVLDFGLARVPDDIQDARLTEAGTLQGTLAYMSPEQCRGEAVGPPTDIYAIGTMLYEFFTGALPFSGRTSADLIAAQIFRDPPPMEQRGRLVPAAPGIEALVRSAMDKKLERRPSAGELRDELTAIVGGADLGTLSRKQAIERARLGSEDRAQRALAILTVPHATPELPPAVDAAPAVRPRVVLWRLESLRAEMLANALAVNGLDAVIENVPSIAAPTPTAPIAAVVLSAGDDALAFTIAARADVTMAAIPILVVDVVNAAELAALVRAGASDVALASVAEGLLCRQLWRLIRRGR